MSAPRRRLPGELYFVLFMLLLGVTALWQAWRIAGFSSWSSPGALPIFAALVMVLSGLKIALNTFRAPDREPTPGRSLARDFHHRITPAVVIWFTLLIVAYMFALEPLGFVLSSFAFLVGAMFALGERRIVRVVLISAISLACIYVIFQTAFSVVLPEGVLRGVLR
jgi:putative tricarboxylic transport membrane protein